MAGQSINPAALNALFKGDIENAVIASTPGGIERQEKEGQSELVNSTYLPKPGTEEDKQALMRMGIVFGEPYDDLFVNVTLPADWKKVATDHSMHSDLVDNKGRKRASIFYKAAFYDRNADITLNRRYSYSAYGESDEHPDMKICEITDCGKRIHIMQLTPKEPRPTWQQHEDAINKAKAYLDKYYPDWQNPEAYWD